MKQWMDATYFNEAVTKMPKDLTNTSNSIVIITPKISIAGRFKQNCSIGWAVSIFQALIKHLQSILEKAPAAEQQVLNRQNCITLQNL